MIKYVGLYLIGLLISVFFLREFIIYIDTDILSAKLTSFRVNDYFLIDVRIFLSFLFGAAYFFFKIQQAKVNPTTRQIILSIIGLIIILIFISFVQTLVSLKIFSQEQVFMNSILPLWLTFPFSVLYFGLLLKYGYKKRDIKWFW